MLKIKLNIMKYLVILLLIFFMLSSCSPCKFYLLGERFPTYDAFFFRTNIVIHVADSVSGSPLTNVEISACLRDIQRGNYLIEMISIEGYTDSKGIYEISLESWILDGNLHKEESVNYRDSLVIPLQFSKSHYLDKTVEKTITYVLVSNDPNVKVPIIPTNDLDAIFLIKEK